MQINGNLLSVVIRIYIQFICFINYYVKKINKQI